MTDICVPRPQFVLGDHKAWGSSLRILYGPEDDNGRREVVGYVDQYSPYLDLILERLNVDEADPRIHPKPQP